MAECIGESAKSDSPVSEHGGWKVAVSGEATNSDDLMDQTMEVGADFQPMEFVGQQIQRRVNAYSHLFGADGFPRDDDLTYSRIGQYQLGPIIGQGSMGRVYRGQHMGLGRTCAIKVLNPMLVLNQPRSLDRFWAEAQAVANLVHPNIVTVYNIGTDRGYHYIEMEYVPGGINLRDEMRQSGPVDLALATRLTLNVAQALSAAHSSGLVHRDVKPSNVLMTPAGMAKLADFGLVNRPSDVALAKGMSGTPAYMAPELFRGELASVQSDLYASGVMFFFLLTGTLPFTSEHLPSLMHMHQHAEPPDLRQFVPDIPNDVQEIVRRCLEKDAALRPSSADELANALQVVLYEMRDVDRLIRESVEPLDCAVFGNGDRYSLVCRVPNNRLQHIYLEIFDDAQADRLITIYSVCCVACSHDFEFALKLNAELMHGGISIREVRGTPMFVMTQTYGLGQVTEESLRQAILEIARGSDWVEQQLTNDDIY